MTKAGKRLIEALEQAAAHARDPWSSPIHEWQYGPAPRAFCRKCGMTRDDPAYRDPCDNRLKPAGEQTP